MDESRDGAEKLYSQISAWKPIGEWRAKYQQEIQNPNMVPARADIIEKLACSANGEFSRCRTINGKSKTECGKWRVRGRFLELTADATNGVAKCVTYRMLKRNDDAFELRFNDLGAYEREIASRGGTAKAVYTDDGTLLTQLVGNDRAVRISQTVKVFEREKR